MFSYRSILGRAWNLTKRYKKLWILGFFVFILSAGGEYKLLIAESDPNTVWQGISNFLQVNALLNSTFWANLSYLFKDNLGLAIGISLLTFLLIIIAIALLFFAIKSQAVMIEKTKKLLNVKKDQKMKIWPDLINDNKKFWTLLLLNISLVAVILFVLIIISLPWLYLSTANSVLAALCYIILFIFGFFAVFSASIIFKYAIAYVALEKQTFHGAVKQAVSLFKDNWLISLEIIVLLFFIDFLIGLAVSIIFGLFILPLLYFWMMAGAYIMTDLLLLVAILLLTVIVSIVSAFETASWTILFLELQTGEAVAKLERVFHKRK
jgi:hypothetical protein